MCANITNSKVQSADVRGDISWVLVDLLEPVDLDVEEASRTLYWTDRGEIPWSNSLNRAKLCEGGLPLSTSSPRGYEILKRGISEATGLKLDNINSHVYLTDLGGLVRPEWQLQGEGSLRRSPGLYWNSYPVGLEYYRGSCISLEPKFFSRVYERSNFVQASYATSPYR